MGHAFFTLVPAFVVAGFRNYPSCGLALFDYTSLGVVSARASLSTHLRLYCLVYGFKLFVIESKCRRSILLNLVFFYDSAIRIIMGPAALLVIEPTTETLFAYDEAGKLKEIRHTDGKGNLTSSR
jgi:YD repeat-containing protein